MTWLYRSMVANSGTSTRARLADPAQVVAAQVDEHDVLGPFLRVGEQLGGEPRRRPSGWRRAAGCRRSGAAAPAAARPRSAVTFRCASGDEPTMSKPSKRSRYMYGLGLVVRSTR